MQPDFVYTTKVKAKIKYNQDDFDDFHFNGDRGGTFPIDLNTMKQPDIFNKG